MTTSPHHVRLTGTAGPPPDWPRGKRFAFTVFDDPDAQTLASGRPVYDVLRDLGFRTTKAVWPIRGGGRPSDRGQTCADGDYRKWVEELQAGGFEIAYHNATNHTSPREETLRGLETFRQYFGAYPSSMANHSENEEGIYHGEHRVSGVRRLLYNALTRGRNRGRFCGHVVGHPYFWGDLCRERITYVRNFVFDQINTLAACPYMPYHDPARPWVNFWFASAEGDQYPRFERMLGEANQDRLEAEGGACIMYTHFGHGFVEGGRLRPRFVALMERLAAKDGWFVPVTTLLEHLRARRADTTLTTRQRARLEWRWLRHKARYGTA
jgi:hypothetical protein